MAQGQPFCGRRRLACALMLPMLLLLQTCGAVPVALPAWATAFKERVQARQELLEGRRFGADEFVALRDEVSVCLGWG